MLGKNRIVLSLLSILFLVLVFILAPAAAFAAPSQDQIVTPGRARFYSTTGTEVIAGPVLGNNAVVSVEKSITGTNTENEFDITLTVKTSVDVKEITMSADAAVVLVLDISGSMGGVNDSKTDYMPALKAAAQNFISSLADDAGGAARYVSLVTFATDAKIVYGWTDITNFANRLTLNNYIQGLRADGATFVEGGLQLARNLMREDALPRGRNNALIENRCVVLFSDGEANRYIISPSESGYSTNTTIISTSGPGNIFDPDSVTKAQNMANSVKNDTMFQVYPKHTAYLYTIAFGSDAPTVWLRNYIATNPTYAYTSSNASDLYQVFAAIAKRIESWAEAWVVTDPMGTNIQFLTTIPQSEKDNGIRDFQNNILSWDLKKTTYDSFLNNIYTYTYTYRIRLDTTLSTFTPGVVYPTNKVTDLSYVMIEDSVIVSNVLQAIFTSPEVKGYAGGSLVFTKVGNNTALLSGCVFTLANQGKPSHTTTAVSSVGNGLVYFTNVPSGHTYTLTETFMPPAYANQYKQSTETYTVKVAYGILSITDSLGSPVDPATFKFNNPAETPDGWRITGRVMPLATQDILGGGSGFQKRFDVVVELRSTFLTPATGQLRTIAVLMNTLGVGEFVFENVPAGNYVLFIKRPGYLARPMLVTVGGSSTATVVLEPPDPAETGIFRLWPGDVNDDHKTDPEDANLVKALLGVSVYDPRYNPACDFNADGIIDPEDLKWTIVNNNRTSLEYSGAAGVNPFI